MNKREAISKINKYGKIGKIITIVMLIGIIVSIVSTTAAAICLKVIPEDVMNITIGTQAEVVINPAAIDSNANEATFNSIAEAINNNNIQAGLNLGAVRLELNSAQVEDGKVFCKTDEGVGILSLNSLGNVLLLAVVSLILAVVSTFFGHRFCKAIEKCESPFEDNVIKTMRQFAFSLLPWAIFSEVPKYAISSLFNNHVVVELEFNFNVILTVLIILVLTVVFKYGAILQKESDETL